MKLEQLPPLATPDTLAIFVPYFYSNVYPVVLGIYGNSVQLLDVLSESSESAYGVFFSELDKAKVKTVFIDPDEPLHNATASAFPSAKILVSEECVMRYIRDCLSDVIKKEGTRCFVHQRYHTLCKEEKWQIGIWFEERHLIIMIFRKLSRAEIPVFLPLVWTVFCKFEASNYAEQAKMIFKSAIYDQNYLAMLDAYGAYEDDVPIGIIATRSEGKHIALFFVDGKYHKQGIGKQLWNVMLSENPYHELSVHSSLYAIPVYERLGFVKTGEIQTEDGITYLPMMFKR